MNMFVAPQRMQISDGLIVQTMLDWLIEEWEDGLTVSRTLPSTKTRRMVTLRDDSGTIVNRVQGKAQGVNVWADSVVDAMNLALDAMAICQAELPGSRVGNGPVVIAATREFSGPFEVEDDVPYIVEVAGEQKSLTHMYFTFTADTKAVAVELSTS